jgi:diguanylate cyclase (GGDEF)-like protein
MDLSDQNIAPFIPAPSGAEFLADLLAAQAELATLEADPLAVLRALADRARQACGADVAVIEALSPVWRVASGGALPPVAELFPEPVRTALRDPDAPPLFIDDTELDPRAAALAIRRPGVRSLILVPLGGGDRVMGFLLVASSSSGAFDPLHVTSLQLLGVLLSAALRGAAEREERRVLEMVARDLPLAEVLEQLVVLVERQTSEAGACVLLVVQDGTIQPFGANLRPHLAEMVCRQPLSFTARLADRLPEGATAPRMIDIVADPAWEDLRDASRASGIEACWVTPIGGAGGERLGLAVAFTGHRREPTRAESAALCATARLAAIAIEHHQTTRQLAYLVRHDVLTGLPNRILFEDRLFQAMTLARRNRTTLALLAIDLDHFKQVNDTLGHQAGDALLRQFARRARTRLRESDTLARVGGDEFMLILPEVTDRSAADMVVRKLRDSIEEEPFELLGTARRVSASIGVALFPDDSDDPAGLQRFADGNMYRIKEQNHRLTAPAQISPSEQPAGPDTVLPIHC